MFRISRRPKSMLIFIPLILLIALASGCGLFSVENEAPPVPPTVETSSGPLTNPVELSVLSEPLDVGFVEFAGSKRLTNGGATEVEKGDQINLTARPVDPDLWRFDRWGGDLSGSFAASTLVMDSSKQIRAFVVSVGGAGSETIAFYGITLNGQSVRNLDIGVDNGSIEVSPAPGPGENPFREGIVVSLLPRPAAGYELDRWGLDCGGSGFCDLTINGNKEVTVSFKLKQYALSVTANPAAGGDATPSGTTNHNHGDRVAVTASPSSGYLFTGFTGNCSGTGACSVLMDSVQNVTANF